MAVNQLKIIKVWGLHYRSTKTPIMIFLALKASTQKFFLTGLETTSVTITTATQQLKIVGVSRDADNDDLTSANVVWRVVINEHFFGATTGV